MFCTGASTSKSLYTPQSLIVTLNISVVLARNNFRKSCHWEEPELKSQIPEQNEFCCSSKQDNESDHSLIKLNKCLDVRLHRFYCFSSVSQTSLMHCYHMDHKRTLKKGGSPMYTIKRGMWKESMSGDKCHL